MTLSLAQNQNILCFFFNECVFNLLNYRNINIYHRNCIDNPRYSTTKLCKLMFHPMDCFCKNA